MTLPVLHQSYAAALPELSVAHRADAFPAPRLLHLNEQLAAELGLDADQLRGDAGIAWLTGQDEQAVEPPGTTAQAYAGHQFGSANPQLGDGRAVLLGELIDPHGQRHDLHVKGSGRTPYARAGADGKAPLGPMLRELVIGEALHGLGIPTTRILAVLSTGERIAPRRGITPEPGGLAVRVAASHLRVGTVQGAAWHHGPDVTARLVRYALERHHPQALAALGEDPSAAEQALALLREVTAAQARLIAQWMGAGFVHGVMNTDNMTLSGQSIDFGPCAFLDVHRAGAVFSSIDTGGRYAYGNQPSIALWNLSRFGEALLPVIDEGEPQTAIDAATAVLQGFEPAYRQAWAQVMAAKLGVPLDGAPSGEAQGAAPDGSQAAAPGGGSRGAAPGGESWGAAPGGGSQADESSAGLSPRAEQVELLAARLLALLEEHGIDHTGFFRALTEDRAEVLFTGEGLEAWRAWEQELTSLRGTGEGADAAVAAMAQVNPVYIARNAHLEHALRSAEREDLTGVEQILEAVRSPFTHREHLAHLETPGDGAEHIVTFCGT